MLNIYLLRYEQHFGELATSGGFSPFGALRHHLPLAEAVGLWALRNKPHDATGNRKVKFPLRGKGGASAPKGVHFPRAKGAVCLFSHARRAVVRFYHTGAPLFSKAPTTPSEPCEPFAPSEPSRPKGVSIRAPSSLDPGPDPGSITHRAPVSSRPHSLQSFLR